MCFVGSEASEVERDGEPVADAVGLHRVQAGAVEQGVDAGRRVAILVPGIGVVLHEKRRSPHDGAARLEEANQRGERDVDPVDVFHDLANDEEVEVCLFDPWVGPVRMDEVD